MTRLAVTIAILMLGAAPAAAQSLPQRPAITVLGVGEVKTQPDVAIMAYSVRGEGATADDAARALVAKQKAIAGAVTGLSSEPVQITNGSVNVRVSRSPSCQNQDYGPGPQLSTGPCAVLGYVARMDVTVRLMPKVAGTAAGLASRLGAEQANIQRFGLRSDAASRRAAVAAAIADAKAQASAIAAASSEQLGEILDVRDQNAYNQSETIVVTGSLLAPPAPPAPPPPVEIAITPEPITTTERITVTFAIQR